MAAVGTLVTDPFEDDARSLLFWAYGQEGKDAFDRMRAGGIQRAGQAFMNALWVLDPPEYERLKGTLVDPFYRDQNLPLAIDRLTSK